MAKVIFPAHIRERIERLAAEAPPLGPEQRAIIRACFTPPQPRPRPARTGTGQTEQAA